MFHEEWTSSRCCLAVAALLNEAETPLTHPLVVTVVHLLLLLYAMRPLIICETFPILIIVFHSHAYSTIRNDGVSSLSAFSYDAELEPLVLGPDGAALSIFSHEAESQGSLFASDDMNRGDSARENQADTNSGRTERPIMDGNDECPPTNRRNRGKMRVRQLSCPVEPMQGSQGPAAGQRIETAPRRTVQPVEMPETEPYIPLQFLKPDEETCLPAITGKRTFFSASNTPVCSTGLDQLTYTLATKALYVTLQECFPCKSLSFPKNDAISRWVGGGSGGGKVTTKNKDV